MYDWWMIDIIEQGQFTVEWSKEKHYISDYFPNSIQVHTTKRYELFIITNQVCLPPVYKSVLKYSSRHIT